MIEIYNKYDKLEVTLNTVNDYAIAISKAKELKIKAHKIVKKSFQRLFTYYCMDCKKRTYFVNNDSDNCCEKCKSDENFYFVGFKQTDKLIKEVFYAN